MILSTHRDKARLTSRAIHSSVLATGLATGLVASLFVSSAALSQSNTNTAEPDKTKAAIQDLRITVQPGDTFSGIVTREMKSYDAWGEIARYNKLESPDNLKPGDVIVIPAEVLRLRNYATVVFAKPKAIHHNASEGTKGNVAKGDKIYLGDLIETNENGFVSMSFNGGSSVNIQPDSTVEISMLDCIDREKACQIKLEAEKGRIGLDVQRTGFAKPTVFSIDSPYANAAVRGTSFDFDVDEGNVLGVTEGSVAISFNGNSNNILAGKGVLAGEGRSINDVFDLLAAPTFNLNDGITHVSSEDVISWDAVDTAVIYQLAYDENESMQSALITLTETSRYTKPELPVGDFYISGRAVDSNGLRGFLSKKQIRSVAIDQEVDAAELDVVIDGMKMQITAAGTPADDIEVKIGNEVVVVDGTEYIMGDSTHRLRGGDTITVDVDPARAWYLQSRKVVNRNNVSPYGLLYFFDKTSG